MQSIGKKILIAGLIMGAFVTVGLAQFKGDALTKEGLLNQLQQTGKKALKPAVIIKAIKDYGVNFLVTSEVQAELVRAGAKPELIDAAKENFRLPNGMRASYLTVTANLPDTQFAIDGLGAMTGGVTGYPLSPGTYKVTAKKLGYLPQSQTVTLSVPGKVNSINFELKEMPVSGLIAEAKTALERGDHKTVRDLCQRVRLRESTNVTANQLLGTSYYVTREFDQSLNYILPGIRGGEPIKFILARRKGWTGYEFGALKLTATSLTFINQKARLGEVVTQSEIGEIDFDVPYAKVLGAKVDYASGSWRISMDVNISKGGGKDKKEHFDFYLPASRSVNEYDSLVCSNCTDELGFILKIINTFSPGGK